MILSPARETYRYSTANAIALTLLALFAAGMMVLFAQQDDLPVLMWAGAAIIAADIVICVGLSKARLTIHDEGVRRTSAFGVKEMEWRNVKEYRYRVASATAGAAHAGGLIGVLVVSLARRTAAGRKATSNFNLKLIGEDGTTLSVTSSFKDAYDAIGSILTAVHDQLRKRVESEIASAGAAFGQLRLSNRDLQWKSNDPVPLREIEYAEVAGPRFVIKKSGKMFKLVAVRSETIPNVLLLLEQMEKAGVAARRAGMVDPLARVRTM